MSITIHSSQAFEQDLREAAGREGISPSQHAAMLLLIGRAMTREGRETRFGQAVADLFASRSLDVSRLATAVDDLVEACTRPAAHGQAVDDRQESPTGEDAARDLGRWRESAVQSARGAIDEDLAFVLRELSPLESLVQRSGRLNRVSGLGKFAHIPGNSEEFAARKQEEIALEDRGWP